MILIYILIYVISYYYLYYYLLLWELLLPITYNWFHFTSKCLIKKKLEPESACFLVTPTPQLLVFIGVNSYLRISIIQMRIICKNEARLLLLFILYQSYQSSRICFNTILDVSHLLVFYFNSNLIYLMIKII